MSEQWHTTLRTWGVHAAYIIAALAAFFVLMGHLFPAPKTVTTVSGATVAFTPSPAEQNTQALLDAFKTLALAYKSRVEMDNGQGVSALQQPAVSMIKDTGLVNGLSSAQLAQILSALKPKTVEAVAVHTAVNAPTPAPTPSDAAYQHVFDAAYAADTKALTQTTIKTSVDITRQEVPPSRVGSLISADGSGLSYAILRRKQYEAEIAAVGVDNHITPAVCAHYLIPHTELSLGPCAFARTPVRYGFAAVVHF